MSQSGISQSSGRRLAWLPPTLGGSLLCFVLGLGCTSGGASGGAGGSSGGSGGNQGSGGATSAGGAPGLGGSVVAGGASGAGGKTGSGGVSETGGKTGSGGTVATGGAGNSAGTTSRDASAATGGSTTPNGDAGPGRDGSRGTGGAGSGGSTGSSIDGSSTEPGKSAGCGKTSTITSSQYNNGKPNSITVGSMERRYILSVPTNYDNTQAYKLVIAFHQLNGNDVQMYKEQYYGLQPLSNNTAIFVAPNGQKSNSPCSGTGSGDSGCGWPNPNSVDTALADAVVALLKDNFCIDTNRIFATGWSYGGAMSYETACARPLGATNGYIRAVAVYAGSPQITQGPCPPSKAVAYYAAHGTNDSVLQYSGGVTMAQDFAKANGCTWATPTQATSAHICTNIAGCPAGYPVEFCSFVGPHTPWPDSGQQSGSWGPGEAWKFLSQF
jgi:poly(3-hydroxybutyrate) depolymerase